MTEESQAIDLQNPLPVPVSNAEVAFPTRVDHLMIPYKTIPKDFEDKKTWLGFFGDMFFCGLEDLKLYPREGVDPQMAWRHLRVIAGSWEPPHEHKELCFAYLASLWFEKVEWKKGKPPE